MRALSTMSLPALAAAFAAILTGCAKDPLPETLPDARAESWEYIIGPGDTLNIFVWRNPELSQTVPVRPDGRISVPLVEDLTAAGKTATTLAREIEGELETFVREPLVTVIVSNFVGDFETQVRVVGQAAEPRALPYRDNMTVLDVMIEVGGLTEFAAGNRARLVRRVAGETHVAAVRLDDLLKDGDVTANVELAPGDVIIIPEAWF